MLQPLYRYHATGTALQVNNYCKNAPRCLAKLLAKTDTNSVNKPESLVFHITDNGRRFRFRVNGDRNNNGLTAHLTIFYISLRIDRMVHVDIYRFTAIGTIDIMAG